MRFKINHTHILLWVGVLCSIGTMGYANEQEWIQLQNSGQRAIEENKIDLALNEAKKASQIAESRFGSNHMKTALSYRRLASIYRQTGDFEASIEYLDKVMQIWNKILGPEDNLVTQLLKEKIELLIVMGRKQDVADILLSVIDRDIRIFGREHTLVAKDYEKAADFFWSEGLKSKALESSRQALTIYSQTVKPTDMRHIERLQKTAEWLSLSGQSEAAAEMWRQHAEIVTDFYEKERHFKSAFAWIQAGDAYAANRNDLQANDCAIRAESLLPLASDLNKKEEHAKLVQLYQRLQALYLSSGNEVSARKFEKLFSEVVNEG